MVGCVICFDQVDEAYIQSKVVIVSGIEQLKRPSQHPISGVPPNWNHVPGLSSSEKARAVITDKKTLLHMSITMIPRHLFGSLRLPRFDMGIHWL